MAEKSLTGKVSVVTGASRGIGKGIAIQLAEQGSKVYITGRTLQLPSNSKCIGSLEETAHEIRLRGGDCVPVLCDHSKDADIERLFERTKMENDGKLDILVNNAFSGNAALLKDRGTPFWEQPLTMWDNINRVGLRNAYLCSVYGARMMVPNKSGIIINISSAGGSVCMFNPAYGIGKAGVDRMTGDCALELKKHNVAFMSLRPGPVSSDSILAWFDDVKGKGKNVEKVRAVFESAETPNFVGKCVVALASDPAVMEKAGKAHRTIELAKEYGISDENGHYPLAGDNGLLTGFLQGHIMS